MLASSRFKILSTYHRLPFYFILLEFFSFLFLFVGYSSLFLSLEFFVNFKVFIIKLSSKDDSVFAANEIFTLSKHFETLSFKKCCGETTLNIIFHTKTIYSIIKLLWASSSLIVLPLNLLVLLQIHLRLNRTWKSFGIVWNKKNRQNSFGCRGHKVRLLYVNSHSTLRDSSTSPNLYSIISDLTSSLR